MLAVKGQSAPSDLYSASFSRIRSARFGLAQYTATGPSVPDDSKLQKYFAFLVLSEMSVVSLDFRSDKQD